jgi:MFS family permease
LAEAAHSYRQIMRLADVRRLLLAACLSRLAGRMFLLAIVLHALDRFQSPALAGGVAFWSLVPGMVISPVAGALLDRVGAARGILADMAASALLLAALVTTDRLGALSPAALLVLAAVYSLSGPLGAAGIRSLLPRLVPEQALARANALDTVSWALTDVLGPVIAGALSGFAGTDATMLVIAMLYVGASACLLPLARHQPQRPAPPTRSIMREAAAGAAYVARHPVLRGLALSCALYQVSWGILLVAVPVVVMREVGAGPTADTLTGTLWAVAGTAAALGALLAGSLRTRGRERLLIGAGALATAAAMYPAGLGLAGLGIGVTLAGFLSGPVDVGVLTLRQRATDPDRLGRVLAISMSLNMSGLPLGSAIAGWVVAQSLAAALAMAAAAAVLAAVAVVVLVPRRLASR